MEISKDFMCVLVIIDTFFGYVELFPTNDVLATVATDALMAKLLSFRNAPRNPHGSRMPIHEPDTNGIRQLQECDIMERYHTLKRKTA